MSLPSWSDVLNYSAWIIGFAGLVLAIWAEFVRRKTHRDSQTVTWEDIRHGVGDLAEQIRKKRRGAKRITHVIASSPRGGILAEMLIGQLNADAVRVIGFVRWRDGSKEPDHPAGFLHLSTEKWNIYLPESALPKPGDIALLVNDIVITGEVHRIIRQKLEEMVGRGGSVITAAVLASSTSIVSRRAPDFHARERKEPVFFWPWGASR